MLFWSASVKCVFCSPDLFIAAERRHGGSDRPRACSPIYRNGCASRVRIRESAFERAQDTSPGTLASLAGRFIRELPNAEARDTAHLTDGNQRHRWMEPGTRALGARDCMREGGGLKGLP